MSELHLGLVMLVVELLQLHLQPGHLLLALVQPALGLLVLQLGPLQVVSILVAVGLEVKIDVEAEKYLGAAPNFIPKSKIVAFIISNIAFLKFCKPILGDTFQAGGNTFPSNEKGWRQNVLVSAKCGGDGMLRFGKSLWPSFTKALSVFCLRNVPILLSGNISS